MKKEKEVEDIKEKETDVIEKKTKRNDDNLVGINDDLLSLQKEKKQKKKVKKNVINEELSKTLALLPLKIIDMIFIRWKVTAISEDEKNQFIMAFNEAIITLPVEIIKYFEKWGGMIGLVVVTGFIIQTRVEEIEKKKKVEKENKKKENEKKENVEDLTNDKDLKKEYE